ncbi:MAG TPA: trypsin-like peptidase domain-containing protein [Candidatus Dormibacteraeota bacterium]|nr:trypsin-like peptidase domain-containing protein [Candidatus Dormibacteraeota bacterium]
MGKVDEVGAAMRRAASEVGGSVVGIGSRLRGSGVVVADGRVLTNAHNLRGEEVTVTFADGRSTRGRVAGADLDGDLAVIEVDTAGTRPVEWGGGEPVTVGTLVFALAATVGGGVRVSEGRVSAVERSFHGPGGRRIGGGVEHTAPLAPGSSGGPIVDVDGRLLGIDTNRLGDGFYLAVPADAALRSRVDALGRGEAPVRRRLGIAVAPREVSRRLRASVGLPERTGLLVRAVEEGGLAERAGVREGDLIVSAGGRAVEEIDDLHEVLGTAELPLELAVVRGTEERTVTVTEEASPQG